VSTIELHSEHSGEATGKVYSLVYLADLDTVPVDRLEQLFAELKIGLLGLHMLRETATALAAVDGVEITGDTVRFCKPDEGINWMDDGKGEISLILPKQCGEPDTTNGAQAAQ